MIEIKEVLRRWLLGEMGLRRFAETVGADRKTVRRYIEAAVEAGLVREGGQSQLTAELLGQVAEAVRPQRLRGTLLERRGMAVLSDAAPLRL